MENIVPRAHTVRPYEKDNLLIQKSCIPKGGSVMERYNTETMSRYDIRRCYDRYAIGVILSILVSFTLVNGSYFLLRFFLPELMKDEFYEPLFFNLTNALGSYLPSMLIFALLLRPLPRAERLPVDRLSLWELAQAVVFSFGAGYLTVELTSVVILGIQHLTGTETSNVIDGLMGDPLWTTILFTVFICPVLEEIVYRKIVFEPLRGLGDTTAVLLSSLAFALAHSNLYQFGYAFVVGMVFACIVLLTGSIRDTCILHILFNGCNTLTWCGAPDGVVIAINLLIWFSMGASVFMFFFTKKNYHMESGPLPYRSGAKRRACFGSVWFWLMLLAGIGLSLLRIFL